MKKWYFEKTAPWDSVLQQVSKYKENIISYLLNIQDMNNVTAALQT